MPQMYSLYLFLFYIVYILVINEKINNILNKVSRIKGMYRIGPHNKDILSIIYGSLLGDAHAEKRLTGVGTRISFFQEDTHVEYLLYLHNLLSEAGYCNNKIPVITKRLGVKGKIRKIVRFSTWSYTSFNSIHSEWYVNNKKCVPNSIDEYLTPLALAI
jgi:ubiquinol-cytochrome c reductase cytochrome b subunit